LSRFAFEMLHLCRFFLCCSVCNLCFFADASAAGDLSIVMSNQQVAVCTIAAGNGIDALFDSGIKIFQSVRQCNYIEDDSRASRTSRNRVACLTDIGDVIASIANLAQYVINIISSCTGHHVPHSRCMQYGFALAGDISKLAASAGEIDLNCIHVPDNYKNTIDCLFDIKFGVHEILQVVEHSLVLKDACETGPKFCAGGVFDVVASLGTLANYVLAGWEIAKPTLHSRLVAVRVLASSLLQFLESRRPPFPHQSFVSRNPQSLVVLRKR